jgi:hypothetical protein
MYTRCNLYVSVYVHKMQFPTVDEYQNEKVTLSMLCNFYGLWWWLQNGTSIEYNLFIFYFEANF